MLTQVSLYVFQVKIPDFQSRCGHRAAAFSLSPELAEVILFGGATKHQDDWDVDHVEVAALLRWLLTQVSLYVFQVKIPDFQSRCGHRAAAFSLGPELAEVILFGGTFKRPKDWGSVDHEPFLGITVLQFGESIEFYSLVLVLHIQSSPQTRF